MIDIEDVLERIQQGPVPDVWVLRRNSMWNASASPKRAGITTGLFACIMPGIILYILLISSIKWYLIGYSGYRSIIIGVIFLIIMIPLASGIFSSMSLKGARNTVLLLTNEEPIYCKNYASSSARSVEAYSYVKIASVSFKVFTHKGDKNRAFVNTIEVTLRYDGQKWPEIWMLDLQDQAFEMVLQDFTKFYGKHIVEALSVIGRGL